MPNLYRSRIGPVLLTTLCFLLLGDKAFTQNDCRSTKHGHSSSHKGRELRELAPMDILHQRITLDLTLGNIIAGNCAILAVPREADISTFQLDLTALTVDSVTSDAGQLIFTHLGEVLEVSFPSAIGPSDTVEFVVHYRGDPIVDASGFGGFYTSPSLIYNLGVAFESIPHSYGRTWFPCLDNFTERSTYEFLIRTAGGLKAWCNGVLLDQIALGGDTLVSHWRIDDAIPAYLVSVAAANYAVARKSFPNVMGGQTPVELIAAASDTTGMKSSFTHLQDAFDHFEALFGPYQWDRVGYVLTTVGAMEHATSIHYPRSIATGNLQYEATMAHELAHHWFGNLITCYRAEEMYINEGFAEYLSYLFLEEVHGRQRYMNEVRTNHRAMVHRAHFLDDGWWALSEMPQEWTYGEHSYNKGADVLHTLRSYMGDEAFSGSLTSFLSTYAFQPVNTIMLRDHLTMSSGMDLTDFFTDFIQQPGWAAFEIDAQTITPVGGEWEVSLTIQQKMRGPASFYHNVPVTIAVVGSDPTNVYRDTVMLGGEFSSVTVRSPFEPAYVWLNDDDRISLAFTGSTAAIGNISTVYFPLANFDVIPQTNDSVVMRVEQYWVAPDQGTFAEPFTYFLSPDRYWRVTGNWSDASRFEARVLFDGRNNATGNLDAGLTNDPQGFNFHEDSLVLLHRNGPDAPWVKWADDVNSLGSTSDGFGRINIDSLWTGEYALALRTSAVGIHEMNEGTATWTIQPNPAHEHILVTTNADHTQGIFQLIDAGGRVVLETPLTGATSRIGLNVLAPGNYVLKHVERGGRSTFVGTVVKE